MKLTSENYLYCSFFIGLFTFIILMINLFDCNLFGDCNRYKPNKLLITNIKCISNNENKCMIYGQYSSLKLYNYTIVNCNIKSENEKCCNNIDNFINKTIDIYAYKNSCKSIDEINDNYAIILIFLMGLLSFTFWILPICVNIYKDKYNKTIKSKYSAINHVQFNLEIDNNLSTNDTNNLEINLLPTLVDI